MTSSAFMVLLKQQHARGRHVCVGLDTDISRLPAGAAGGDRHSSQLAFNCAIVDATADIVAAYKPNSAFYEGVGVEGIGALIDTVRYIRQVAPDVPVILDAKRGDIGSTNIGYASFAFDVVNAHAITVHPYLGSEAAREFCRREERGVYVLCRTSNPGAAELQDVMVDTARGRSPVYLAVASLVRERWNTSGNCGLVVGATYPAELSEVRSAAPDLPILIPGIGAQGGDLRATVAAAQREGKMNALVNSSRSVIFASSGPDFAEAARNEALKLDAQIRNELTLGESSSVR